VDLITRADELIDVIRSAFPNGQLDLLVIDTFARNSSGDENSTEQMKLFVVELDKIVEAFTGLCLLLVHHNNRAGAWRGNSAVDGALNTIFMMESRNDDEVVVHCDKQKDSEEIDDFLLRKRLVPLVETPDHPGMILQIDTHADPDGDTILEYLDKSSEKNTRSDEVGGTRDDVLKIVKAEHAYGDKKFNEIWKRLKESKQIVTADGKPEKPKGTRWVRNLALLDLTF
jgi:RecA-family ATPase